MKVSVSNELTCDCGLNDEEKPKVSNKSNFKGVA